MDTACLKIKFTPFLKQSQNENSKCSVEIVPEVSCVQNLDKIEWKRENDFMEYIIPITYKIILKRRHYEEENETIKTYHSCLELPPLSSLADLSLGSGDVTRIISDPFIVSKLTSQVAKPDTTANGNRNMLSKMTNTILHMTDVAIDKPSPRIGVNISEVTQSLKLQAELNVNDKVLIDKTTDTNNIYYSLNKQHYINYQLVNFTTVEKNIKPNFESTQNQISDESHDKTKVMVSNTINKLPYNLNDYEVKENENICTSSGHYDENQQSEQSIRHRNKGMCSLNNLLFNCRMCPKIRIAQYIQVMEEEIMPLKIMLNEILHKCKVLGVTRQSHDPSPLALLYQSAPAYKNIVTETQELEKSNRVVYSIFFHEMDNQALLEQIVQNLAFEVEAVPKNEKDNSYSRTTTSKSTPLSVKIRVRKKDKRDVRRGIISIPKFDDLESDQQKIRLVNSDQTILSFDVFMEATFEKKPLRKSRRNIINKLTPGICLGASEDEEYQYFPSTSYGANVTDESQSDGVLKQNFTLSKNTRHDYALVKRHDGILGNCKPGGCLDPPFSEDKYPYKPNIKNARKRDEAAMKGKKLDDTVSKKSSIFGSDIFKKIKKSVDPATHIKEGTEGIDTSNSILKLYQVESTVNSLSTTQSNLIITYPTLISSDMPMNENMLRSRISNEEKFGKSINAYRDTYYTSDKNNLIKKKEDNITYKSGINIRTIQLDLLPKPEKEKDENVQVVKDHSVSDDRMSNTIDTKTFMADDVEMVDLFSMASIQSSSNQSTDDHTNIQNKIQSEVKSRNAYDEIKDASFLSKNPTPDIGIARVTTLSSPSSVDITLKDNFEFNKRKLKVGGQSTNLDYVNNDEHKKLSKDVDKSLQDDTVNSIPTLVNISNNQDINTQKNISSKDQNKTLENLGIPIPVLVPSPKSSDIIKHLTTNFKYKMISTFNSINSNNTEILPRLEISNTDKSSADQRNNVTEFVGEMEAQDFKTGVTKILVPNYFPIDITTTPSNESSRNISKGSLKLNISDAFPNNMNIVSDLYEKEIVNEDGSLQSQPFNENNVDTELDKVNTLDVIKEGSPKIFVEEPNPVLDDNKLNISDSLYKLAEYNDENKKFVQHTSIFNNNLNAMKAERGIIETHSLALDSSNLTISVDKKAKAKALHLQYSDKQNQISKLSTQKKTSVPDSVTLTSDEDKQNYSIVTSSEHFTSVRDVKLTDYDLFSESNNRRTPSVAKNDNIFDDISDLLNAKHSKTSEIKISKCDSDASSKKSYKTSKENISKDDWSNELVRLVNSEAEKYKTSNKDKHSMEQIGRLHGLSKLKDYYEYKSKDNHEIDEMLSLETIKPNLAGIADMEIYMPKLQEETISNKELLDNFNKDLSREGEKQGYHDKTTKNNELFDKNYHLDLNENSIMKERKILRTDSAHVLTADILKQNVISAEVKRAKDISNDIARIALNDIGKSSFSENSQLKKNLGENLYLNSLQMRIDTLPLINSGIASNRSEDYTAPDIAMDTGSHISETVSNQINLTTKNPSPKDTIFFEEENHGMIKGVLRTGGTDFTGSHDLGAITSPRYASLSIETLLDNEVILTRKNLRHPIDKIDSGSFLKNNNIKKDSRTKSYLSRISVPSSTNTLKSELKIDTITIDLAIQSFLNDKNKRVLKSFDAAREPKRYQNDSITVVKSEVRLAANEIRVPIDTDNDMFIYIKKAIDNKPADLKQFNFVSTTSTIDGLLHKQKDGPVQFEGNKTETVDIKHNQRTFESDILRSTLMEIYDQELVPLQHIIKALKEEIDVLATQQILCREKLYCSKKSKAYRERQSRRCGCLKKPQSDV